LLWKNRTLACDEWHCAVCLTFVDCAGGRCDDKNTDHLPTSEELERINDELEKEYLFALKKVNCLLQSCFLFESLFV